MSEFTDDLGNISGRAFGNDKFNNYGGARVVRKFLSRSERSLTTSVGLQHGQNRVRKNGRFTEVGESGWTYTG